MEIYVMILESAVIKPNKRAASETIKIPFDTLMLLIAGMHYCKLFEQFL